VPLHEVGRGTAAERNTWKKKYKGVVRLSEGVAGTLEKSKSNLKISRSKISHLRNQNDNQCKPSGAKRAQDIIIVITISIIDILYIV
jgi:hypothetical protein